MAIKPLLLFILLQFVLMENSVLGQTIEQLLPAYIEQFKEMLNKDDYKGIMKGYSALYGPRFHIYESQWHDCNAPFTEDWSKHDSCAFCFFGPIFDVLDILQDVSHQPHTSDPDPWSLSESFKGDIWKNVNIGKPVFKSMMDLMKKVLSKYRLDSYLFRREMIYARLNYLNPGLFPWKESPLAQTAQKWYEYAKQGNDQEIRKVLDLNMTALRKEDQCFYCYSATDFYCYSTTNDYQSPLCSFKALQTYCSNQTQRIPLCSFLATKIKYEEALRSLPQNNPSNLVSIWAYLGDENGQYKSLNEELDRFLLTADIKDSVDQLSKRLSGYFETLARFDNGIAQADVGYLTSAIDKNNERLGNNARKMTAIVQDLKKDRDKCALLDFIENMVMIAVNVAGVAAGGAGALTTISSLGTTIVGAKRTFVKVSTILDTTLKGAQSFVGNAQTLVADTANEKELKTKMAGIGGAITEILEKFAKNKDQIDGMNDIMEAAIGGTDLSSVQIQVDNFLANYSDYTPGVTKADLAQLNKQYEDMLDSFANSFEHGGIFCKIALSGAPAKVREAKAIWTLIYALLEDIYSQQFDLITALIKVVRSKLDETAAKTIEPDINYNFEIIVRHMLTVRVAAQEVCNAYQLLYNDGQDNLCQSIRNKVFLSESERRLMVEKETLLSKRLDDYPTNNHIAYIPVSNATTTHAIFWNDLISGNIAEFSLPVDDKSFLLDNGWIDFSEDILQEAQLLKSLQVFIPNVLPSTYKDRIDIQFAINASQESVVVNEKPNAQRYSIRSHYPLSTKSTYKINETPCQNNILDDLYVSGSKYCIPSDSGHFGDVLKRPLPVSMFSKFQIRLQIQNVYPDTILALLRDAPPFGDTLKLRVSLQVFSNSGLGVQLASRTLSNDSSHTPSTEPCGPGQYRRIIDARKQECVPCPDGSVPYAQGSYCISQEAAKKIADQEITTPASVQAKPFESAPHPISIQWP